MVRAKIEAEKHGGMKYIKIDGQAYVFDSRKDKGWKKRKTITIDLKPVDPKLFENMVNEMAEKLAAKVNVKELMRQAICDSSFTEILAVKKELQKKKPKIRTQKGCLFMQVGKGKIWLRE